MQVRVWDVERQKEVAQNKIHCNVVRLSVRVPFFAATINVCLSFAAASNCP